MRDFVWSCLISEIKDWWSRLLLNGLTDPSPWQGNWDPFGSQTVTLSREDEAKQVITRLCELVYRLFLAHGAVERRNVNEVLCDSVWSDALLSTYLLICWNYFLGSSQRRLCAHYCLYFDQVLDVKASKRRKKHSHTFFFNSKETCFIWLANKSNVSRHQANITIFGAVETKVCRCSFLHYSPSSGGPVSFFIHTVFHPASSSPLPFYFVVQ